MLTVLLIGLGSVALLSVLAGSDDAASVDGGSGGDPSGPDGDPGDTGVSTLRLGSATDNLMSGTGDDELLAAFNGNDQVMGGSGADILVGDNGDDTLSGGFGDDVVMGGTGNDQMSGGAQDDLMVGGAGNDTLAGDAGNDELFGMDGNNRLDGGAGNDVLNGLTPNNPVVDVLGGYDVPAFRDSVVNIFKASDTLADRVVRNFTNDGGGVQSRDVLLGGDGDDTLIGDDGDLMTAGLGQDVFAAISPAAFDPAVPLIDQVPRVTDFDPANDRVEILVDGTGLRTINVAPQDGGLLISVEGQPMMFLANTDLTQFGAQDVVLRRL